MGRKLQPGVDKISETWVKDRVKEILKRYNVVYFMPSASQFGKAGSHDFICCFRGRFISIETKAGAGKPSAMQIKFADDVTAAGGISLLINEFNYREVDLVLHHIISDFLVAGHNFNT